MERLHKVIAGAGVMSLTVGIVVAAVGIAAGSLCIVSGARLLQARRELEK